MRFMISACVFTLAMATHAIADIRSDVEALFARDMAAIDLARLKIEVDQMIDGSIDVETQLAEIDQMVKDAEAHADEDKKKRELIDLRNQADSTVYQTEKSLKEMGDKVSAEDRSNIEGAVNQLKTVKDGEDGEAIKKSMEDLQQFSHKLAEAMYAENQAGDATADASGDETSGSADDDVVDADFEEVKDDK